MVYGDGLGKHVECTGKDCPICAATRRVKNLPEIFGDVSKEQLDQGALGKFRRLSLHKIEAVFVHEDAEYETLPDGTRKLPCLFYGDLYFEKEEKDEALHDQGPDQP